MIVLWGMAEVTLTCHIHLYLKPDSPQHRSKHHAARQRSHTMFTKFSKPHADPDLIPEHLADKVMAGTCGYFLLAPTMMSWHFCGNQTSYASFSAESNTVYYFVNKSLVTMTGHILSEMLTCGDDSLFIRGPTRFWIVNYVEKLRVRTKDLKLYEWKNEGLDLDDDTSWSDFDQLTIFE